MRKSFNKAVIFSLSLLSVINVYFTEISSYAQKLSPRVEVTNDYVGKLTDIRKTRLKMNVPDSLFVFNYDVDYTVFDNKYRGSYNFRPYRINVTPASAARKSKSFYLDAGMGYHMYPRLDIMYSPVLKEKIQLDFYENFNSYFGNYYDVSAFDQKPDSFGFGSIMGFGTNVAKGASRFISKNKSSKFFSYDFENKLGMKLSSCFDKSLLSIDLAHYTLGNKYKSFFRWYNAFDGRLDYKNLKADRENYFFYDISAGYKFANDFLNYSALSLGKKTLNESHVDITSSLGAVLSSHNKILFDLQADVVSYSSYLKLNVEKYSIKPHYTYNNDFLNVDLGINVVMLFSNQETRNLPANNQSKGQIIYPHVKFSWLPIRDRLEIYSFLLGGNEINTYSSLLRHNPHFNLLFIGENKPLFDNTTTTVNAALGLRGNFARRLQYELRAGSIIYKKALLDAVYSVDDHFSHILPAFEYDDYNLYYLNLSLVWKSKNFDCGSDISFKYTNLDLNRQCVFAPAMLSGNFWLQYNIYDRVFFETSCKFASFRRGTVLSLLSGSLFKQVILPAYVDLSLALEYRFTQNFSCRVNVENACNMAIQHHPLYVRAGTSFTIGICFNK